MGNKVILVNYKDQAKGEMEKSKAHAQPNLHRAFSVFLYQNDKILLQKRAKGKYHCGGLWTNTCCSHPQPGEEVEEAARRRLYEEMNIVAGELQEIYSFVYYYRFENGICEFEFDHVLLGEYFGEYSLDAEEAEEARWVDKTELLNDMEKNPQNYTPWFLICAPEVIKRI